MKKLISHAIAAVAVCVLVVSTAVSPVSVNAQNSWYSADAEYVTSVGLLYANAFTRYNDSEQFRPASSLTRQEAAKMFLQLFMLSDDGTADAPTAISSACMFDDVEDADSTLKPSIELACEYGIMRGSAGSFRPFDELTKAEAVTVIIRIQEWMMSESVEPRWRNYREMAYTAWVTTVADVYAWAATVTRYEAALLIARVLAEIPWINEASIVTTWSTQTQTQAQQEIISEIESLLQAFEWS